jgi:PAS domain S-box-containing protein
MAADTAPLAARDLDAAAMPLLGESALLGGVYFVLAFVAIHMGGQPHAITNVWFANAAAIAILATTSRRRWLPLLGVIAAANVAANAALRGDLALSASFVPGNLIEVVIGAALLVRTDLAHRFDDGAGTFTLALVAGGMLPQLAGATLGAATLQWHGFATFNGAWLSWYVDSTLGAMAVLPLALALRNAHAVVARSQLFTGVSLLFGLVTIVAVLVTFRTLSQPYIFLTLPLMASVFFVAPASTFALCFVLVLVVCGGLDYGWFSQKPYGAPTNNLLLYLPAAAAVLPAQLLAVVVSRMRLMQADTDALTTVGGDSTAVLDRQGVFRGANHAYQRNWAHTRQPLIGLRIEDGLDPRDAAGVRRYFELALQGQTRAARAELDTPDGPRVVDVRYQPVLDARGQVGRVLCSSHDVTELVGVQRELEHLVERLRAANEGMQQFVRIASHDMREPLNSIVQFCGLIEADHAPELAPAAHLYFTHVKRGAQRMRKLLDDVLSFERLEGGDGIELGEVALDPVFATVQAALDARITQSGARIEVMAPLPVVMGQESLLVLLFQNLVSNGIKFTEAAEQPQVRVEWRAEGDVVIVTVADRGIGIAPADQNELFVPFKRLHTRRKYDGSGLGLAISKRIADAMGGSIRLESQPGAGTQVHVTLRRAR